MGSIGSIEPSHNSGATLIHRLPDLDGKKRKRERREERKEKGKRERKEKKKGKGTGEANT